MTRIFTLILFIGLGSLAGCGSRLHTVSSSVEKKDSTRIEVSRVEKDSTVKVTEAKVIPAQETDSRELSGSLLDSIKAVLSQLPKGVSRTVYLNDPKTKLALSLVLDSLGKMHVRCASMEQIYYQTSITQTKTIDSMRKEMHEKDTMISRLEVQKSNWYRVSVIMLVLILILFVFGKIFPIRFGFEAATRGVISTMFGVGVVSLAWMEVLTGLAQVGALFGSIAVSIFTVIYLIKKTKSIKEDQESN